MTPPALVSLEEARTELGIAKTTAYRVVRTTGFLCPGLPALRIGSLIKFSRAQLDRIVAGDIPAPAAIGADVRPHA